MLRTGIKHFEIPKVEAMLAEGKPPAEIAELLGCPVSTIESFFAPCAPKAKKADAEE